MRSRVESRYAPHFVARLARHDAVDVSEKTKAVMTSTPTHIWPRGKKRAPDADADRADDGHDVRADAELEEEVGDRTEDLVDRRAQGLLSMVGTAY